MKQKKEIKKVEVKEKIKSNPKIDEIVKDFPTPLCAYPRARFEEQLKNHLIKHKIK